MQYGASALMNTKPQLATAQRDANTGVVAKAMWRYVETGISGRHGSGWGKGQ